MKLSKKYSEALQYAADVHRGQYRKKTKIPYLSHLLGVSAIAMEYGGSEAEAIAALLHDAPEDRGGRAELDRIRATFGDEVAEIVKGCTDAFKKRPGDWKRRKKRYITRLKKESASVCLVSASDKLYNARSILKDYRKLGERLWKRFNGNRRDELWYYRGLIDAFDATGFHRDLIAEIDRVVSEIERLAASSFDGR